LDAFADAVAALYEARFASLFRYLDRLTGDPDLAEDLAQDTFVRLHRRGAMPDDPRAWLATVATNLFRDQRRQARRRAELVSEHAGEALPGAPAAADSAVLTAETRSRARTALDTLPDRDRMLLLLRHEGYSYRELARAVGVAESSVGTLLIRATRMFREAVGPAAIAQDAEETMDREASHASE
jgi:RNA polymerase sigma-70 factor (ECF subfamily)